MSTKRVRTLLVLLGFLGMMGLHAAIDAPTARAIAGIVVNSAADTVADDGVCTLREAITSANTNTASGVLAGECAAGISSADNIFFNATVFNPGTITLTSALPDITTNMNITGLGATLVTVDGANSYRPFYIGSGATVTLSGMTITHGNAGGLSGGGIRNEGTLTVANSTISGNTNTNSGGGILSSGGTLTVTGSTFSGNSAGHGGGIKATNAILTVTNSTFSGNTTTNAGAAVYASGGTSTLTNVTISGNTVTNYTALWVDVGGTLNLNNSIVANTTGGSGDCGNDGTGTINAQNSLIESGLGCVNGTNTNNLTGDPNLGALANNGGPTQTLALLSPSIAINAGNNTLAVDANSNPLTTDQRGAGFPRIYNNGTVDMGAFELQLCLAGTYNNGSSCVPAPAGYFVAVSGATEATPCAAGTWQDLQGQTSCKLADPGYFVPTSAAIAQTLCPPGTTSILSGSIACTVQSGPNFVVNHVADTIYPYCDVAPGSCTLRAAIHAANALSGADTITFGVSGTILLGSNLPAINDALTIDGAANGSNITVDGASAYRVFLVNSGKSLTLNKLTIMHGVGSTDACGGYLCGGGISNLGTLTVSNSTFSANSVTGSGGGIYHLGAALTVTNSTFSGNSAGNQGGGLAVYGDSVAVTNSTFSGNSAGFGGGGIGNLFGTVTLKNTIVANSPGGGDCGNSSGTLTADAFNLDSDGSCNNATTNTTAEIALGPLANNGGPTKTMALGNSSVAIDAGDNAVCAAAVGSPNYGAGGWDQRGQARNDLRCDIGAFEVKLSDTTTVIKSVSGPGTFTFGPTLAKIVVNNQGSLLAAADANAPAAALTSLTVQRVDSSHLSAGNANLQTGHYWTITPSAGASGYNLDLTLPALGFTADANDKLCRYTGSDWDCAASGFDGTDNSVTRSGVTQLSDWTVGNNVGPNAVTLRGFTASGGSGGITALWAAALAGLAGLGAVFVRRRLRNSDSVGATDRSPRPQTDSAPDPGRSPYQPPAIIHRGQLELRAGSPLVLPDFMDPNNPFP